MTRRAAGFALVSTLAILVIVTILLVAFATTMRTERAASQNFADRDRAEAIGMGMLNRILAEHASPIVNGNALQRFQVNPVTGLPTTATAEDYYAAGNNETTGPIVPIPDATQRQRLLPVYQMVPDNDTVFDQTGLVRTSRPASGSGGEAYSREYWAYDGLTRQVLGSDAALPPSDSVPRWVDYYQPDDPSTSDNESRYPVAQVAFAIWDEGGKFDVNVAGKDASINGLAPHDLKIEEVVTADNGAELFAYLDNRDYGNGRRDRNNFSLRNVVSPFHPGSGTGVPNDQGDDRWVFSVRELVQRGLIAPNMFRLVTTSSRDFDVRPEWDGDRAPKALRNGAALGAEDFLRSYINNPALFGLLYGSGAGGPYLVYNNLNEQALLTRLENGSGNLVPNPNSSDVARADWMQVMRLLAVLRRALPQWDTNNSASILAGPNNSASAFLIPNRWSPFDIWGVAQNLIQASAPAFDYNLVAFNPNAPGVNNYPYNDPNARVGIRLSPYIVEVAIKVRKVAGGAYDITNYIKLWNPFPFRLQRNGSDIHYRVGLHTGRSWPGSNMHGLIGMEISSGVPNPLARADNVTAPNPGEFKVIQFYRRVTPSEAGDIATNPLFRVRPYLQIMDYAPGFKVGGTPETPYQCLSMPGFYAAGGNDINQLVANLRSIPSMANDEVRWYSFQIDDPRMGSIKRDTSIYGGFGGQPPEDLATTGGRYPAANQSPNNNKWTWVLYNQHALRGCPIHDARSVNTLVNDPDIQTNYNGKTFIGVSGYNTNFGVNWPGAGPNGVDSGDDATFAKMMSTFALPGRPFLNIGEIGTVFAFRPWVTLNFANKIIPDAAGTVTPPIESPAPANAALLRPAAILDYYTTIGTPDSLDFDNPESNLLRYLEPSAAFNQGQRPPANPPPFIQANVDRRYQDKTWFFEAVEGSLTNQLLSGNLRPIRGRINLNTASTEVLTALLKAPYRMPASLGLRHSPGLDVSAVRGSLAEDTNTSDYLVTIDEMDARAMAQAITRPISDGTSIRPLRMLSDLSQLYDKNPGLMQQLYAKYPQSVITAMIGRLAQFGTVRQQAYTIDMVVRMLNPAAARRGEYIATGEARLQARVFFDTFSRQAFIESVEYK